ncbi:MAG: hypothetical protein JWQ89_1467 [Devosia sp.]|uniref:toll/interleukin-1 receptor domain-containing protein n=1 Tax=Devosia sp. TaxID=1871048 RepID=UPI00260658D4|nr:toll/interleukin-1 receptor domain-containing protein [Devosia sp.]MDB5539740.1 hypothetical protein [Devosia sp.]
MPDIFVSHKVEEQAIAGKLAKRLTEAGYDVWWTGRLTAGERFEDEITSMLEQAKVAVILWSRLAAQSDWVRAEAETARKRDIALPAVIDDVAMERLPMLFRHMHMANLKAWDGSRNHPGFQELFAAIKERIGVATGPVLTGEEAEAKLAAGADEDELWEQITQNPDQNAEEYHNYFRRFGETARFADLARMRIKRLEEKAARRRWNWGYLGSIILGIGTLIGGVVASAQWLQDNPIALQWLSRWTATDEQKAAAQGCTDWFSSGAIHAATSTPMLRSDTIKSCEVAASVFSGNNDYKAMLALAYLARSDVDDDKAEDLATRAAERGSMVGKFTLGLMYLNGFKFIADPAKAVANLKQASDGGLVQADALLCDIAANSNGQLPTPTPPAVGFCRSSSEKGNAVGQRVMGYMLEFGINMPADAVKAAELYRLSADQGNSTAQYRLGSLYERGVGVDKDYARALELYQSSADQGDPGGQRHLAVLFECGRGVAVDYLEADRLYWRAATGGDNVALYLLGNPPGPPTSESTPEIDDAIALSEDQECSAGLRMLAFRHTYALAVPRDDARALALYQQAAADGNPISRYVLATLYNDGFLVPEDDAKAFELAGLSAAQGIMHGQFELGLSYELGIGTEIDFMEAAQYYRLAAAQGYLPARDRLRGLPVQ